MTLKRDLLKTGFSLIFLVFIKCKEREAAAPAKNGNTNITIKVNFLTKGGFGSLYIDTAYRNSEIKINNSFSEDTTVYRTITTEKPTIFSFLIVRKNDYFSKRFIALPGDTLSFLVTRDSTTCIAANLEPSDLDLVYGEKKASDYFKMTLSSNLTKTIDSSEQLFKRYETSLKENAIKYKWRSKFLNALLLNNKLLKYISIFKIDYSKLQDNDTSNRVLERYYDNLLTEKSFFEDIYAAQSKILLHYLVQYGVHRQRLISKNIYHDLFTLDKSLHKKKFLDGFIYDMLKNDQNPLILKEKKAILETLDPIIYDKENFFTSDGFRPVNLEADVLNSLFSDLNNEEFLFKDLLKTNKKIILIDFWASWCVPCIAEFPYLDKIRKKYGNEISIISISIDEDKKKWSRACKKLKLIEKSYLILNNPVNKLAKTLKLNSIPRYVLINTNGQIIEDNFLRPSDKKFEIVLTNILSGTN